MSGLSRIADLCGQEMPRGPRMTALVGRSAAQPVMIERQEWVGSRLGQKGR